MKTILYLDGTHPESVPRIRQLMRSGKIVVHHEGSVGNRDTYEAPTEFLETLRTITETRDYDAIVIGNNEGKGIDKAAVIHESKRRVTIVVSDGRLEAGARREYEKLGYTQFVTRIELPRALEAMLHL